MVFTVNVKKIHLIYDEKQKGGVKKIILITLSDNAMLTQARFVL